MLKIAYIGRDEILQKAVSKKGYVKHDFYYTSIQENHFSVKSELEKLYALKDITLLMIDTHCIEEQSDMIKNLTIFKTIRSYIEIILITDKKLYSDEFEVLYFPESTKKEVELEDSLTLTEKFSFKLSSNDDRRIEPIIDFKNFSLLTSLLKKDKKGEKQESKIVKPVVNLHKLRPGSLLSIKIPEINISNIKKRTHSISHISKDNKRFSFSCKGQKGNFVEEQFDIPLEKVNIFTSKYHLQGISFVIHMLKEQRENCAILDLSYSYISYTKYSSMEQYITETLIVPQFLEKKNEGIYTVSTSITPEDLQKVIRFLSQEYEHILIDTNDSLIGKMIPQAIRYSLITEDFALLNQVKYISKKIEGIEGTVIVNRYTNTIEREEFSFLKPIFVNEIE